MQKIIYSTLFAAFIASHGFAADSNNTKSAEELMKELAQLNQQIQAEQAEIDAEKAKTKALDQLERTVDELSKELGVEEQGK